MDGNETLLAVDLGLRTGFALYGREGRLLWYRSSNFGTSTRMRKAVPRVLQEADNVRWLILEGGGRLAIIWEREAARLGIPCRSTSAHVWRELLLLKREQRSGSQAKRNADTVARRIIEWSSAPRPTSLKHDAAEAICVGLWGVLDVGWLPAVPGQIADSR